MARRRVSAMFMREEDLQAVQDVLSEQSVSGRVVIGTAEDNRVVLPGDPDYPA